ncbi:murein hydrolase activator EnvC family protein [Candidatus Soleaferrea massiliensis]|uniref:murein hydrolase activator EnvC family protein n=1 Tax=Candidatus Soleaferrea massiliensis TaxID=1470354 RepID=UPI00069364C6|nr:peptidoglycan DD-metalloendopeptidase family protein [Candidatus Soleaferrea massiliensis]
MQKNQLKRAVSFVLALTVLMTSQLFVSTASTQDELDSLKNQYSALEQQKKELQDKISQADQEKKEAATEYDRLVQEVELIQGQIDILNERMAKLNENIEQREKDIQAKEKQIDENYELFKKRLRAMYMAGDTALLEIILGSESYTDMLTKKDTVNRIAQHDNELIETLLKEIEELKQIKSELEQDKQDLEASRQETTAKKTELDSKMAEAEKAFNDIATKMEKYQQSAEEVEEKQKAMDSEIDDVMAQLDREAEERRKQQEAQQNQSSGNGSSGESSSGGSSGGSSSNTPSVGTGEFTWPMPGYGWIICHFGYRPEFGDNHGGIDITGSGCYGADIVAADSGRVAYVGWDADGWGKYLIIDHENGYRTLYAHTSAILVSEGQSVSRGQTIAKVGDTGWTTGPHLHFEVYKNGVRIDPESVL